MCEDNTADGGCITDELESKAAALMSRVESVLQQLPDQAPSKHSGQCVPMGGGRGQGAVNTAPKQARDEVEFSTGSGFVSAVGRGRGVRVDSDVVGQRIVEGIETSPIQNKRFPEGIT